MRVVRKECMHLQMVHEYIEDREVLASALLTGYAFAPALIVTANALITEAEQRGWA